MHKNNLLPLPQIIRRGRFRTRITQSYFQSNKRTNSQIATVIETVGGKAKTAAIDECSFRVYSQTSNVPFLQHGDQVLVQPITEGIIITGRLLSDKEHPIAEWKQTDNQTLELNFGRANIQINQNGNIKIENSMSYIELLSSGEIKQTAKQDIRINADRHIHLNSPNLE